MRKGLEYILKEIRGTAPGRTVGWVGPLAQDGSNAAEGPAVLLFSSEDEPRCFSCPLILLGTAAPPLEASYRMKTR